jgi:Transposase and inactivated derivatives
MKDYQKKEGHVKEKQTPELGGSVQMLDPTQLRIILNEGLDALSKQLGMEVLGQLVEQDVVDLVGQRGKHNANRIAYRHGSENTKVVMGGEKVPFNKPRVRAKDGKELSLPTLELAQSIDPLSRIILTRVLNGVSTRKYERTLGSGFEDSAAVSKSDVSRRFNAGLEQLMAEFFDRRLDDDDYPIIMIDGMSVGGMTVITVMGITNGGEKRVLGLITGGTENSIAVKALLEDLVDRGLKEDVPRLYVLDGSKALAKAVKDMFGMLAVLQRCQVHKKRNVLSHLPQSEQANIGLAISKAYLEFDYDKALRLLEQTADNLEHRYPDAAASLREGLEETLTVHKLGVPALLRKTVSNTNAMESLNSTAAGYVRRIRRWRDGEMILRHMAAAFSEAEKGLRRLKGYRQIPLLKASLWDACTDSRSAQESQIKTA